MNLGINCIEIDLGKRCNLNCKYCIQHGNNVRDIPLNDRIFPWLESIANASDYKIQLTLMGGEPLLYMDTIKKIVDRLGNRFDYVFVTNGSLLTDELVGYFNEKNIMVKVSWDGHNSIASRGYDVFAEKKDLLAKLNRLSVSAVGSVTNYPLEFFSSIEGDNIKYVYYSLPLCDGTEDFSQFDLVRFRNEMQTLCDNYYDDVKNNRRRNLKSPANEWIRRKLNTLYFKEANEYFSCIEYAGTSLLMLRPDGTFSVCCHQSNEVIATIDDPLSVIVAAHRRKDDFNERYAKHCNGCPYKNLCVCSCLQYTQFEICELTKAAYEPVVKLMERLEELQNTKIMNGYKYNVFENIYLQIPNGRKGEHRITNSIINGQYYPILYYKNREIMNAHNDKCFNELPWHNANGNVLLGGLGVGELALLLANREYVSSVTIIEQSQEVIDLVEPYIKHDKIKVIRDDILTYVPDKEYDYCYVDIWDCTERYKQDSEEKLIRKNLGSKCKRIDFCEKTRR